MKSNTLKRFFCYRKRQVEKHLTITRQVVGRKISYAAFPESSIYSDPGWTTPTPGGGTGRGG